MAGDVDNLLRSAFVARRENRPDDARRELVEAVVLARAAGSRSDLARAITRLGAIERGLHSRGRALVHNEEASAIFRAEGDRLKLAHTVRHIGDIYQDDGQLELAEPFYMEALAIHRDHSDTPHLDLANAIRLYALEGVEAGVVECRRRLAR